MGQFRPLIARLTRHGHNAYCPTLQPIYAGLASEKSRKQASKKRQRSVGEPFAKLFLNCSCCLSPRLTNILLADKSDEDSDVEMSEQGGSAGVPCHSRYRARFAMLFFPCIYRPSVDQSFGLQMFPRQQRRPGSQSRSGS